MRPILVMVIDAIWGWTLTTYGKPWLLELLNRPGMEASRYYETYIEPRLWISYGVVLSAQLIWVSLIAPRTLSQRALRQLWWFGCAISIVSAIAIQIKLQPPRAVSLLLLAVQWIDVTLLYWLSTGLVTPPPKRSGVIPGWG